MRVQVALTIIVKGHTKIENDPSKKNGAPLRSFTRVLNFDDLCQQLSTIMLFLDDHHNLSRRTWHQFSHTHVNTKQNIQYYPSGVRLFVFRPFCQFGPTKITKKNKQRKVLGAEQAVDKHPSWEHLVRAVLAGDGNATVEGGGVGRVVMLAVMLAA